MSENVTPVNQYLKSIDVQPYERYLPNAFNDSLTMLEKINKVIYQMQESSLLTNEMVRKWNEFTVMVNEGGLIDKKISELLKDDELIELIDRELMIDFKNEITKLTTETLINQSYKTVYIRSHRDEINRIGLNQFLKNKMDQGFNDFVIPTGFVLNEELKIHYIRNVPSVNKWGSNSAVVIRGEGGNNNSHAATPHFILNTGRIGISLIETHGVELKQLNMSTKGATNPSTVGVLLSRESGYVDVGSSHTNKLTSLTIDMQDDPRANNGKGTVGIYNDTSETITHQSLFIKANVPMVVGKNDPFNLCPQNTYSESCKDLYFQGYNGFVSYGGANSVCLLLDGVENIVGNLYFSTVNMTDSSCSIQARNVAGGQINVDSELVDIFLKVKDGFVYNLEVTGNAIQTSKTIVLEKTNTQTIISGSKFNLYVGYGTKPKVYIHQGIDTNISSCEFFIGESMQGTIFNIAGAFNGNKIFGLTPLINYLTGSSNMGNKTHTRRGELYHNSLQLNFSWGIPISTFAPFTLGDVFFNVSSQKGSPVGYTYNGTDWDTFGQRGYRTIEVANIPNTLPLFKGEILFDQNNDGYIAYNTSIGGFKKLT